MKYLPYMLLTTSSISIRSVSGINLKAVFSDKADTVQRQRDTADVDIC